jgi:hypothetical protein
MESAHRCGQDEGGSRSCPSKEEEESWNGGAPRAKLGTGQAATDYGGNGWSLRGVGGGGFYAHDDDAIML